MSRRTAADARNPPAPSAATRDVLNLPDPSTAIYVPNNLMLVGVMLTTVRQPVREMGGEAVRLFVDRITRSSHDPAKRLVQPTLIVRESCAPRQS